MSACLRNYAVSSSQRVVLILLVRFEFCPLVLHSRRLLPPGMPKHQSVMFFLKLPALHIEFTSTRECCYLIRENFWANKHCNRRYCSSSSLGAIGCTIHSKSILAYATAAGCDVVDPNNSVTRGLSWEKRKMLPCWVVLQMWGLQVYANRLSCQFLDVVLCWYGNFGLFYFYPSHIKFDSIVKNTNEKFAATSLQNISWEDLLTFMECSLWWRSSRARIDKSHETLGRSIVT